MSASVSTMPGVIEETYYLHQKWCTVPAYMLQDRSMCPYIVDGLSDILYTQPSRTLEYLNRLH